MSADAAMKVLDLPWLSRFEIGPAHNLLEKSCPPLAVHACSIFLSENTLGLERSVLPGCSVQRLNSALRSGSRLPQQLMVGCTMIDPRGPLEDEVFERHP